MRWLQFTNAEGRSLRIEGQQPLCFSAMNIYTENLDPSLGKKQQHPSDLHFPNQVDLHIDLAQRGVGVDDSGEPCRISNTDYWTKSIPTPIPCV